MHVFKDGKTRSKSVKRVTMLQSVIALFGVLVTGLMLRQSMGQSGEALGVSVMMFGVAVLGCGAQSIAMWTTFFGKPGARVILTSRTLAVKLRGKPAFFLKRSACLAYAPERRVFYFTDGSEFSPQVLAFLINDWQEIPGFVFEHWWTPTDLEAMKKEVDSDFPITRWTLALYFGGILACFVIAMFAIIGGFTGWLAKPTVYGLICALVLIMGDWLRRHVWLLRRETERGAIRFELPVPDTGALREH